MPCCTASGAWPLHAVKYLEGAFAVAPAATRIHYSLAMAHQALGNRSQAQAHLQQRGDSEPAIDDPLMSELSQLLQNAAAYEVRGSEAMGAKRWPDAVANLRKAIALAPDNATTRLNLGTALYMTNDAAGALEQFQAAVRLSPGLAKAHFAIGVLMQASGRDGDAIVSFSRAVTAEPGAVEMRPSLADALRRTGQERESLPHYAETIKADPRLSQAVFGYAMALVRLGRFVEARDRLTDATKRFPSSPGLRMRSRASSRLLPTIASETVRGRCSSSRASSDRSSRPRSSRQERWHWRSSDDLTRPYDGSVR